MHMSNMFLYQINVENPLNLHTPVSLSHIRKRVQMISTSDGNPTRCYLSPVDPKVLTTKPKFDYVFTV